MHHRILASCFGLGLLLAAGSASAADDGFVSLFNGKDLDGWVVEGDAKFVVEGGLLKLTGGFGWLRSEATYGDFELHIEWRAEADGYDSGVFLRTANDGGTPWPKRRSQVNLRSDQVGLVVGSRKSKAADAVNPPGKWNTYDITCRGQRITVSVNGKPVNDHKKFFKRKNGYVGFQAEEHKFAFRNIRVKEFDYQPLCNGKDLTGWKPVDGPGDNWKVENGILSCTGAKGSTWLRTDKEYRDFDIKLDFKHGVDGNSGVFLRSTEKGEPAFSGMEINILHADGPKYGGKLRGNQITGSLYAKHAPSGKHTRPVDVWNHMEISCRGHRVKVWLNGHRIINADLSADTEEEHNLAKRAKTGYIGLQNHSTPVWFRNIRLRP